MIAVRLNFSKSAWCGILAALIWAFGSVVSRWLAGTAAFNPADLAAVRYAAGFPIAAVLFLMLPAARPSIAWWKLTMLVVLAGPPYQVLLLWGYGHATAGAGALILTGLMPVITCFILAFILRAPFEASALTGAVIAAAGTWIFARGLSTGHLDSTGVMIFLTAAVMWACLGVLVRRWAVSPLQLTVALMLSGPLFMPWWLAAGTPGLGHLPLWAIAVQAVYHGALVGVAATLLFLQSVAVLGAARAGAIQASIPGLAALLGALVLGEPLGLAEASGAAFATLGLVISVDGDGLSRRLRRALGCVPSGRRARII